MIRTGASRAWPSGLRWRLFPATLGLALLALTGCTKKSPLVTADGGDGAQGTPPPSVISAAATPVDAGTGIASRPRTTSWSIAAGNLDGDIAERTQNYSPHVEERMKLFDGLLTRAQYVADVADYERADELTERSLKGYPASPDAHLARAVVHGALHRFEPAIKELDEAVRLGAEPERVASTRASIFMATGRYDEAEKLIPPVGDRSRPSAIVTSAVLAGAMQRHEEAERLFDLARTRLVDVSPFPVAWMDFQRARLLEVRGKDREARRYYAEAVDVIPVYAHAIVHLAATDAPAEAITRLEALRKTSSDPDVLAALAIAHKRAGHDDDAKTVAGEAKARYDELVAKHPEAYRDHAARFYLGIGNDPKKALEFAEKNAQLRPTEEAIDLWMAAAMATNDRPKICASSAAMRALKYVSPERKRLAAAAVEGCR